MTTKNIKIFVDERLPEKGCNWGYYGVLITVENGDQNLLCRINDLRKDKDFRKEFHFSALKDNQKIPIYKSLISLAFEMMINGHLRFYILGIDRNNIDNNLWEGIKKVKEDKIFDKFLAIAIYSALKWFFLFNDSEISNLVIEEFVLEQKSRHHYGNFNLIDSDIQIRNMRDRGNIEVEKDVEELLSDHEKSNDERSNFLQLTDVLLGCSCQLLDGLSSSNCKCEVAYSCLEPLKEVVCEKPKFSGHYYKKIAVSFFPKSKKSKQDIQDGRYDFGQFYNYRPFAEEKNSFVGDLFDGSN